jgi:O-succinylbenzoate synthase
MRTAVYAIPMRMTFRGQSLRTGLLIEGPAGWAEFSPFPDYGQRESARWLAAAREAAFSSWPTPVRSMIPVNCIVPAVGPQEAVVIVATSGCRTAKVKVGERGQTEGDDIDRVEAVRHALGASGRLRVDANGAWSADEAVRMIKLLSQFDLEYVEQPCATLDEMAAVRKQVDVPLAADESIRRAADPLRVRTAAAADVVVLKAQPIGGVRRSLEVAEACGLPAVVSSALETSVGLAAGVALAAALPDLPYACGLASLSLLSADVTAQPLLPVDGEIAVRRPVPDPALLDQMAAPDAVAETWRARLHRAESILDP